ncbi:metallophosphoesterase, partial [Modestobacter sp. VKM Ac-2676]
MSVVLLVVVLLHGYLWLRLVRGTTRPGRVRRWLTLLTVVLAVLPLAAVLLRRSSVPQAVATPLDWVGYTWLGVAFYGFLAVLATEPIRLAARLLGRRQERRAGWSQPG